MKLARIKSRPAWMQRPRHVHAVRHTPNAAEHQFIKRAQRRGWIVIRKGWPDYLCFRPTTKIGEYELMAVEVKPFFEKGLEPHQIISMSFLALKGLPCFVYGAQEERLRPVNAKPEPELILWGSYRCRNSIPVENSVNDFFYSLPIEELEDGSGI